MLPTSIALVAALLLVFANAFFVASEFAIVKIRPTRLEHLAATGNARARIALGISRRLDEYLSANQLGITLASLALGWLGEPAFSHLLEPLLAKIGVLSPRAVETVSFAAAFVTITFLHTVVGELAPKSLAIQRTEPVALWTAAPLRAFYVVAWPLIWTLNASAMVVLRMIGLRPTKGGETVHSPEELRLLVRRMPLDAGTRKFIDRVFDYTHRIARHVMILRRDVVTLAAGRPFQENLQVAIRNQYTRYPLVHPDTDEVLGYVHLKDLLAAALAGRAPDLRELAREPVFATEETAVENIREAFQRRRVHLAVVRDSDGRFSGIVTLEDLLEELVGEIRDEQDAGEIPPILRLPQGRFEVDGRLTLDVAARELGLEISDAPAGIETVGGYVASKLASVPRKGDAVMVGAHRLIVRVVRDQRVVRLHVEPIGDEEEEKGKFEG